MHEFEVAGVSMCVRAREREKISEYMWEHMSVSTS